MDLLRCVSAEFSRRWPGSVQDLSQVIEAGGDLGLAVAQSEAALPESWRGKNQ